MISTNEYPEFFGRYIDRFSAEMLLDALDEQLDVLEKRYKQIPSHKVNYRYAEGKWSVAELLGHVNDTERVFQYRALRIARDQSQNPGFDHNAFVEARDLTDVNLQDLWDEWYTIRMASISLFSNLSPAELKTMSVGSGPNFSVRACGYIMAGHLAHHLDVLTNNYEL